MVGSLVALRVSREGASDLWEIRPLARTVDSYSVNSMNSMDSTVGWSAAKPWLVAVSTRRRAARSSEILGSLHLRKS